MPQAALYQVLSIHGYQVTRTEPIEKSLLLYLEPQPRRAVPRSPPEETQAVAR